MALQKTRQEMEQAVRTNLDEISPSFWPAADIPQFLNRAKDRAQLEVRKIDENYFQITRDSLDGVVAILGDNYDCANFRIVPNTLDFTLPPDLLEPSDIRCLTSGYEGLRLTYRRHTDAEFRRAVDAIALQTPRFYTLLGERTWRPAPRSDVTLDFALTYTYVIPDLTTGTSPLEMPHPLYMAVEQYATAEALMKDHSADAAAWEAKGNATIALWFGSHRRQSTDVEVVHGYLEEEW